MICLLQAGLTNKDSQIADLQENIKSQQAETSKAKEALTAMENWRMALKASEQIGKLKEQLC